MKIAQIAPKIYALEGQTTNEIGRVMIRIQEHYESPKFAGKVFTMEEFIPWYMVSKGKDTFTFFEDWAGYNVPSYIIKRFYKKFSQLRTEEQWLREELAKLDIKGKFYLIAYQVGDERVTKHEIAHGLFYTNRKYKKEVLEALAPYDTDQGPVAQELRNHGYGDNVIVDEFHAWVLTDSVLLNMMGLWTKELDNLKAVLETIFDKYTKPKTRKTRSDKGKKRNHCSGYGWCEIHGEHGP